MYFKVLSFDSRQIKPSGTDGTVWKLLGEFTFSNTNRPQLYPVESGYASYLRIIIPDKDPSGKIGRMVFGGDADHKRWINRFLYYHNKLLL